MTHGFRSSFQLVQPPLKVLVSSFQRCSPRNLRDYQIFSKLMIFFVRVATRVQKAPITVPKENYEITRPPFDAPGHMEFRSSPLDATTPLESLILRIIRNKGESRVNPSLPEQLLLPRRISISFFSLSPLSLSLTRAYETSLPFFDSTETFTRPTSPPPSSPAQLLFKPPLLLLLCNCLSFSWTPRWKRWLRGTEKLIISDTNLSGLLGGW